MTKSKKDLVPILARLKSAFRRVLTYLKEWSLPLQDVFRPSQEKARYRVEIVKIKDGFTSWNNGYQAKTARWHRHSERS